MSNYTDEQKRAFRAGQVYGTAKAKGRWNVKPENQASWKAGVKAGKEAAKKAREARRNTRGGF